MRIRLLLGVAAIGVLALVAVLLVPHSPEGLRRAIGEGGPGTFVLFVVCGAGLTVAMFPGALLAAAAGLSFGPVGAVLALVTQTLGGVIAALLARGCMRGGIQRLAGRRVTRVIHASADGGPLTVAALRAAPGMPAGALHYALGVSRVRLAVVAFGLLLGAAPRVVAYALLGGDLTHPGSSAGIVGAGLLVATTLASGAWLLHYRAR